jgi:hypothetical protein
MHYGEFYLIFRKEVGRDFLITVIPAKALPSLNLNCFTISALLRRQFKHAKLLKPLMDVH